MTDEQAARLEIVSQAAEELRNGANAEVCKKMADEMEACIPADTPVGDVLVAIAAIAAKSVRDAPVDTKNIVIGAVSVLIRAMADHQEKLLAEFAERGDATLQ